MVEVTVLPPQEEPSKPTAQVRPQSLGEHMRAFMNKNNANGFVADEDNELGDDTVCGILLEVMFGPGMTIREKVQLVNQIRHLTRGTMSTRTANTIVVNALGYKHMDDVASKVGKLEFNTFIPNIFDSSELRKMYDIRTRTKMDRPLPTGKDLFNPQMYQVQQLLEFNRLDTTDGVRRVSAIRATRCDGHQLPVLVTTPHHTQSPRIKKLAVKLADEQTFDLLVDVERLEVGLGENILKYDLDLEIGVSLCNLNHRQLESTSAARSLVFANSGLNETEYFNRKLRFQAAIQG